MNKKLFVATLATISTAAAVGTPMAMAGTQTTVTVKQNAYLISAPKSGSSHVALETAGTHLTVESGGNRYWWHVRDPQGRDGYITTNSKWTSSSTTSTSTASSASTVQVISNAYLISAPKSGSGRIALETAGTRLTMLSGGNQYWWHVKDPQGRTGYITTNSKWTSSSASPASSSNTSTSSGTSASGGQSVTVSSSGHSTQLPPGVRLDSSIRPLAGLNATPQAKFNAILQVAKSKLGTPYVWGHNEDRGQYGFDCSNYVEYVFHHALGYLFSTSSRTQYTSVGRQVPKSDMQPGDLLCFNNGGHSGIYIGNGEMIQEGGGLGKVGYLKVSPGSYWYNHISAVKRMF